MKYLRITLLLLTVILIVSVSPTFLFAESALQANPDGRIPAPTDPEMLDPTIPPMIGGSPYPFPIVMYEPPAVVEPTAPDAPAAPVINVWYGNTQNFGQLGTPQEWINILGNVSGTPPVTSLKYSLNNAPDETVSIGPNGTRLENPGDFNIELHYSDLNDGANTVLIKASDGASQTTQLVTVNYDAGNAWPLPYTADWNAVAGIQSSAQVVDGLWSINGEKLVTVTPGYDRLVTLGSMNWTDYEVEVPVIVHSLNPASTQGSGVGLIVRWLGHYDTGDNSQPLSGWRRLGALTWYRWAGNGTSRFEMRGNGGQDIVTPQADRDIQFEVPYIFKLSVQSSAFSGNTATYRFKFWPEGEPEPPQWYITATGNTGEPAAGSVVLVAHHAMVSWGNVKVTPIQNETFTINVQQPANGSIIVTPDKPTYNYGETVEIRSLGQGNYVMSNWTGSFTGNENPLVFDITENITVGAAFELGSKPKLNITTNGQGSVEISPIKPNNTYSYGDLVTLTPKPKLGYIFAGWTGDLTGANNPAQIIMDTTKDIVANFISSNPDSPISDDFNACALNTNLWAFVNPVGDGSYEMNGTQLRLNVPANVSHNIWADGNRSVRVMQPTQNVDFEIVTKFESAVTKRFQMQGILVEEDSQNFLRFEVHFDGTSNRLYVARIQDGNPKAIINGVYLPSTPPYLRVTRVGPLWSFSSSDDGNTWFSAGSFNFPMAVTKSGVFGANHGTLPGQPAPAHTAIVDYFFNSAAPITPEDGNALNNLTVTVNKVGQGTVTVSPAKPTYTCGEKVTLTAVPATGWIFSGWSGDLTGTNPTQQVTVSRNLAITATFTQSTGYKTYMPMVVDR